MFFDALVEVEPVSGVVRVGEEQAEVVPLQQLQVSGHLVEQLLAAGLLLRRTDDTCRQSGEAGRQETRQGGLAKRQ